MLNKGSRCGFDVACCIVLHGLYRIFLGNIGQHFGMKLKNDLHLLSGGTGGPAVVVGGVAVGVGVTAIKYNKIILILSKNTNFSHNFFSESESYWNFYV